MLCYADEVERFTLEGRRRQRVAVGTERAGGDSLTSHGSICIFLFSLQPPRHSSPLGSSITVPGSLSIRGTCCLVLLSVSRDLLALVFLLFHYIFNATTSIRRLRPECVVTPCSCNYNRGLPMGPGDDMPSLTTQTMLPRITTEKVPRRLCFLIFLLKTRFFFV